MIPMDVKIKKAVIDLVKDDLKEKEKGITRLQSLLAEHCNDLKHEDYFTLWEGLIFAMWSIDGITPFQQLCSILCKLLFVIPMRSVGVWFDAIWFTLQREWTKLDRYRIDKFQLFIRMILSETFLWLQQKHWSDEAIEAVVTSWEYGPLRNAQESYVVGVIYQFLDVFQEELHRVIQKDEIFTSCKYMSLIRCFLMALAKGSQPGLAQKIYEKIILLLDPLQDDLVEKVASFLFSLAASRSKDVRVQRIYASLEALDASLARVGKKVDYAQILDQVPPDPKSSSLDVKGMICASKTARKQNQNKKKKTRSILERKKSMCVTFRTRRRKIIRRRILSKAQL